MADPQIRVGITATTNAAEVAIAQAYQKMAAAALELQNVQSRHNDILKAYQKQAFDASTATKFLSENLREQADVTAKLTAAKVELKAASQGTVEILQKEAVVQEQVAQKTEKTVSSYYAAQGAARVLEGGIPIRAFEKFISTISGVGPLLQAAFPVIGLLALGELAVDAGKKIYEAFDLGGTRAARSAEEMRQVDNSFRTLIDSTEVEIDRLEAADAKIQKKPNPNAMKLAIDEAIESADRLASKLDGILEKEKGILLDPKGGLTPSTSQHILFGEQGNEKEQKMLAEHIRYLDQAKSTQEQLNESKSYGNVLTQRLTDLTEKQLRVDQLRRAADATLGGAGRVALEAIGTKDYTKEIESTKFLVAEQEKETRAIQATIDLQKEQERHAVLAGRGPVKPINYQDRLAAQEEANGGKNLVFEVNYWREIVAQTGKYHTELLRAEEEEEKLVQKMGEGSRFKKKLAEDEQKETPKAFAQEGADVADRLSAYYDHAGEAYARYREEVVKGNEVLTENVAKLQEVRIAVAEQSGALSRVAADHALGAVKAKEYADRIAELHAQMLALKADLPAQEAQGKGGEASAQIQSLQNQIYALSGQAAAAAVANQGKTSQDISAPFLRGIDSINNAWLSMQNKLIFGTKHVSQAFANMGVSMLESVAASFEKMLVRQLQFEIQSIIAHQTANATKVTSDATAAAAGDAIKTESALKENFMNAKTAATGAFKGVMSAVPPPLNFILAPVAAAAAFAGTLAVGAFEKGGLITAPTLALMGESGTEAVLPNKLTTMLLNVANGGGNSTSNSSSSSFTQTNNFHGSTDREFRSNVRRHSSAIADAVGREMRGGRRR